MPNKTSDGKIATGSTAVIRGPNTPDGRELWYMRADGKKVTLTTSSSSAAVMDEAVQMYGPALRSLANR